MKSALIYFVFEQGLIFTFKVHNIRAGTRQTGMQQANSRGSRPFNLHLDFWKSRSWEIKVCFNFRSCTPGFFFSLSPWFFSGLWHKSSFFLDGPRKKCRFAGPKIFLRFEADLDFSRPWFSEIKVQIKRPSMCTEDSSSYW